MDISRIAGVISEQINDRPQELLDRYAESVGAVEFAGFSNYCSSRGITITEAAFAELLAGNSRFLFTESEDGWIPTLVEELEEALEI